MKKLIFIIIAGTFLGITAEAKNIESKAWYHDRKDWIKFKPEDKHLDVSDLPEVDFGKFADPRLDCKDNQEYDVEEEKCFDEGPYYTSKEGREIIRQHRRASHKRLLEEYGSKPRN